MREHGRIEYSCDMCGALATEKKSHYHRTKRHFCSMKCYAMYRKDVMPPEEQNAYGTGHDLAERSKRRAARDTLNHATRDGIIARRSCEVCGEKAEAHHDDYDRPLDVRWFCFKHHREYHKNNPELMEVR